MLNDERIHHLFPFLNDADKKYQYFVYELCSLYPGWIKKYGINFCVAVRHELVASNLLDTFVLTDVTIEQQSIRYRSNIKCKGVDSVVNKYSKLLLSSCCKCGDNSSWLTLGWNDSYCNSCANAYFDDRKRECSAVCWEDEFKRIEDNK